LFVHLGIPVLGICLGAQLLAYTLGAVVRPAPSWELGWYDLQPTVQAAADPLLCALVQPHPVFQWHGYTFDAPDGTVHLARSDICENQAFRYGHNAYGFQFHLELDERLINRWLGLPAYLDEIDRSGVPHTAEDIRTQTHKLIGQSVELSYEVFGQFLKPMGQRASRHVLPSR
jgi:GMP synthase (glutamine-hydrolysing)